METRFSVSARPMTAPTQGPFTQSVSMGPVPEGASATRELTIGAAFDATAAAFADQDAVVYADRNYRLTWRQFKLEVDTMARGLMGLGVVKGEKVAVWATNVPHWVTLQFATAQIGAMLLTINTNYKSTEIDYLLRAIRDREHLHHRRVPRHRLRGHPVRAGAGAAHPAPGRAALPALSAPQAGVLPRPGEAPGHVRRAGGGGHGLHHHRCRVPGRASASWTATM